MLDVLVASNAIFEDFFKCEKLPSRLFTNECYLTKGTSSKYLNLSELLQEKKLLHTALLLGLQ